MRKFLLLMTAMIVGTTLSFAQNDTYELVTSESSLTAGDEVLIVYVSGSTYYAIGAQTSNGNYRSGVNVNVSNNAISLASNNTNVTRFTIGKNSSSWTFYSDNDKAYLAAGSSSYLTTTTNTSTSTNVTLGFSGNSGATSFRFGSNSRYLTYTNSRFSTANREDTNIRIFKLKVVANPPTFTPAGGNYDTEQNVMLLTTTLGAKIYYTTDGSTPTTNSTEYTNAIFVGEGTTTIKAIAVNRGVTSEVAEATYVIKLPEKETFHLVTNAATLTAGDTILVVYGTNNKVMGNQMSEGNRASTKVSIADNTIVMLKEDAAATRLILGGTANARTFKAINNTEGFLYNSGTEGYLKTQSTAGDYAKASIAIAENGNATITFTAEGSNNLLAYYSAGPGGDDPTPPIVGAPRKAPVVGSEVDCFTFINEINEDEDYYPVQIYSKNIHEVTSTDINMDGQTDIADVTMLVNYLLGNNSNNIDVNACDIDGSGTVNADDIPALINIILSQE